MEVYQKSPIGNYFAQSVSSVDLVEDSVQSADIKKDAIPQNSSNVKQPSPLLEELFRQQEIIRGFYYSPTIDLSQVYLLLVAINVLILFHPIFVLLIILVHRSYFILIYTACSSNLLKEFMKAIRTITLLELVALGFHPAPNFNLVSVNLLRQNVFIALCQLLLQLEPLSVFDYSSAPTIKDLKNLMKRIATSRRTQIQKWISLSALSVPYNLKLEIDTSAMHIRIATFRIQNAIRNFESFSMHKITQLDDSNLSALALAAFKVYLTIYYFSEMALEIQPDTNTATLHNFNEAIERYLKDLANLKSESEAKPSHAAIAPRVFEPEQDSIECIQEEEPPTTSFEIFEAESCPPPDLPFNPRHQREKQHLQQKSGSLCSGLEMMAELNAVLISRTTRR
jgi:hypothetical protein